MAQDEDIILLQGGLDLVTPAIAKKAGFCIAAQNYESNVRGYGRMEGYERLDGQPYPHLATYSILSFDSGSVAIVEGDTVEGDTSGATGIALEDATLESGTYGAGDAVGFVPIYNVSGTFLNDEGIEVSAANVATANGADAPRGASDGAEDEAYVQAAIEKRRAMIAAVPGSGGILGVCTYAGDIYAWRNNAGGTAAIMHKATAAGWVAQTFGHAMLFNSGGTTAIVEGETLTGVTSAATGVVERVIHSSGTWAGGDAAGYFILSGVTGTFNASEDLNASTAGANSASTNGATAAITLPPGGKYRTIGHNFYGTANLSRLYFVNEVGYAHEWDGTVLAQIRTGLSQALDKPKYIGVHNNHLLLGYAGGALLNSGTGLPLSFVSTDGAAEYGIGQDITGIKSSSKTATVITARNKISYLVGNDSTDFEMKDISEDSGAIADTLEMIGEIHLLDDLGVRSLTASERFGDWAKGTVTQRIEPLFKSYRAAGRTPVGALRVRSKDQYRLIYPDRTVISLYFGRKEAESMPFILDFTPTCVSSGEGAEGSEILLAGASDGFVYLLDVGASADGQPIEAFIVLPFNHHGAPNIEKRYHRALISAANGGPNTTLLCSANFSFGDSSLPAGIENALSMPGSGGFWDIMFWEQFYWDSEDQSEAYADLNGIGKNVSIAIASEATYEDPHTLSNVAIYWTPRRKRR